MHDRPMGEHEGTFDGDWKPTKVENPSFKCRKCGSNDVWYKVWTSDDGAYDDVKYECRGCGRAWWVEGDDG